MLMTIPLGSPNHVDDEFDLPGYLLLDSGASTSIIRHSSLLHFPQQPIHIGVQDAQDNPIPISSTGILKFHFANGPPVKISAASSPNIRYDLISLDELDDAGIYADFSTRSLRDKDNNVIATLLKHGPFYWLSTKYLMLPARSRNHRINNILPRFSFEFIHRLFGHVNIKIIKDSIRKGLIKNISYDNIDWSGFDTFQCPDCLKGKSTQHKHYVGSRVKYQREYNTFEFLHTDLFGPVPNMPTSSPTYFISFTDEQSRFRWVFPLRSKDASTVTTVFRNIVATFGTQFDTKVLVFQMDRGSEFTNAEIRHFFRENGIQPCYTSVGDSRAHGVAERLNRTLLDDCRTLLESSGLSPHLWFYSVEFATLIRNALLNTTYKTSARARAGLAGLDASTILPFGQHVITHDTNPIDKLHVRGHHGYALTPSKESHGYLIYVPHLHKVLDTSNYVVIRSDTNISADHNYDSTVFDPLMQSIARPYDDFLNDTSAPALIDDNSSEPDNSTSAPNSDSELSDDPDLDTAMIHSRPESIDTQGTNSDVSPTSNPVTTIPLTSDIYTDPDSDTDDDSDSPLSFYHSDFNKPISSSTFDEELPPDVIPISDDNTTPSVLEDDVLPEIPSLSDSPPALPDQLIDSSPKNSDSGGIIADTTISLDTSPDISHSLAISPSGGTIDDLNTSSTNPLSLSLSPQNSNSGGITQTSVSTDLGGIGKEQDSSKKRNRENDENNDKDHLPYWEKNNMSSIKFPPKQRRRIHYINSVKHAVNNPPSVGNTSMSYRDAISSNQNVREKELYRKAYMKELDQLMKHNTWDNSRIYDVKEVNPKKIINSMIIFTTKRDGTHKCRFVARGDQQNAGTYDDSLIANTIHHEALMTCMAIALDNDMFIVQLDISSAYLYADLKEELYIRTPPHLGHKNKIFKLEKSLYGLKQSGANWYENIKKYLTEDCGMSNIRGWPCAFKNEDLIVCLFVDDIIVFGKKHKKCMDLVQLLKLRYETKVVNDGKIEKAESRDYDILGLEITYRRSKSLSFGMEKSLEQKIPSLGVTLNSEKRRMKAPGQPGIILSDSKLDMSEAEYKRKVKLMQKLVGLASYLGYKYRYDLLYYINILAQHTLYPSNQVLSLTYQLIQYIWDTRNKRLIWPKAKERNTQRVTAITDAAFANQPGYKSQVGYFILVNNKIITARSTKATLTCISSTESELYAISMVIPLLNSIKMLMETITGNQVKNKLITDSAPAISIINSQDETKLRNKYFGARSMKIRDEVKYSHLKLEYVNTDNNIADILTKALPAKRFNDLTNVWMV
ncbi:Tkp1 protein [Vanderwaltozyma polyspora DSM 70294]|uniref:Gag-Pol-p199 n=1 Tax=Vanderwaltozyma polyspora (strain ATCC 22028 / DSM 70294 / BCRC 21397 / CBS 2163 / NBRC 10782 / NRRL Y-8283 / UCD 57-17) TaxID=436907 RepID=A7TJX6_VANPO|nr:Tkp1 protein [Vanderwaltozyma polyspora DSM 70294]EDO17438.1 Tkp1 protein [Vanderwaltozyma polyspora DSM 70294]